MNSKYFHLKIKSTNIKEKNKAMKITKILQFEKYTQSNAQRKDQNKTAAAHGGWGGRLVRPAPDTIRVSSALPLESSRQHWLLKQGLLRASEWGGVSVTISGNGRERRRRYPSGINAADNCWRLLFLMKPYFGQFVGHGVGLLPDCKTGLK